MMDIVLSALKINKKHWKTVNRKDYIKLNYKNDKVPNCLLTAVSL